MNQNKVFVVGDYSYGGADIRDMFARQPGYALCDDVNDASIVVFTGGEDVDPKLYGEKNTASSINTERDAREIRVFNYAQGKKIIGICRGAQLCNVLSGGRMYQDVTNHGGYHPVIIPLLGDEEKVVNSTHHQMMRPSPEGVLIGWTPNRSRHYLAESVLSKAEWPENDVEIVFYPKTNSLCFQPHPEWDEETAGYFFALIERWNELG